MSWNDNMIEKNIPEETIQNNIIQNDLDDKYLRLLADFENYKKRVNESYSKTNENITSILFKNDILPIYDNFNRCNNAILDSENSISKGLRSILSDFYKLFDKYDIIEMQSLGQLFDWTKHDAISYLENNELPDSTILKVIEPGFEFKSGTILRHAKVIVSKNSKSSIYN